MKHLFLVDPSYRSTGIALVRYGSTGPPEMVCGRPGIDLRKHRRDEWAYRIGSVVQAMCAGELHSPGDARWIIEDWDRHSNYDAAVRLAQVQQAVIDVAASCRAQVWLMHWLKWQVPTGVNKAGLAAGRAHRGGAKDDAARAARNAAAKTWAKATYRLPKEPPDDVAQALCMGGIWIQEERERASKLEF